MSQKSGVYKKLHRWPGLIISFILLYYSISGIFMNHRETFSRYDVGRGLLPKEYHYRNWNNAALKGNLILAPNKILVYGNIGIWLTDSSFQKYTSFNHGFPMGSDNRRIFDVVRTSKGALYAGTLLGLYGFDPVSSKWLPISLGKTKERINGIECVGDTLYVLSRSFLYKAVDCGVRSRFEVVPLLALEGDKGRVTLFQTIWQLHSGEIFGLPGKLFVDLLGILTAFLSITGIVYFFFPGWIKRRFHRGKTSHGLVTFNKWSLKWHNKLGAQTFILLIILYFTGMFLRPPLLLTIATTTVPPIKFSHLDQPNPWYDKFRDILYDADEDRFLISTLDGMVELNRKGLQPRWINNQPPVSVMGLNAFSKLPRGYFLVGSFSGLFIWNPNDPVIHNFITGEEYHEQGITRPIGDVKITGLLHGTKRELYFVDYSEGIFPLFHEKAFPHMPDQVLKESKMSLWNLSLEFHTGRIFEFLIGDFYILVVPLTGIASVVIVFAGYMVWRRKYKSRTGHGV